MKWPEIEELFFAALRIPRPERDRWLEEQSGGNAELLEEVRSLLRAHEDSEAAGPQRSIGPYRLERLISRGGMGEVWLASRADGHFEQRVAIKLVLSGIAGEVLLPRFHRERQLLARLNHPCIAGLLDGGVASDGRPYLVMEYVEGEPLFDFCNRRRLDLRAQVELFRKLCSAVEYAHRNLIVHRDIKPGNVLITADGTPKLLDFGVAKLLEEDDASSHTIPLLTPRYASPEQLRGEPVTTASDVYSLGVLLFELLAGSLPYRTVRGSAAEIITAINTQETPRVSSIQSTGRNRVPAGDLDAIVSKALEKTPAERYGTVESLSADLENYLEGRPVAARSLTTVYRLRKYARRHWLALTAAAVVAVFLSAATGISIESARNADRQRIRAERVSEFLGDVLSAADPAVRRTGMEAGGAVTLVQVMQAASKRIPEVFADDPANQAQLHRMIATTFLDLGMLADCDREVQAGLAHVTGPDADPAEKAMLLHEAAMLDFYARKLDEAESKMRAAVDMFAGTDRARRSPNLYAIGLNNFSMILSARGKAEESEKALRRAAEVLRAWPSAPQSELALLESNLALSDLSNGKPDLADQEVRSAIARFRRIPRPPVQLSTAEANLGILERLRGHPQAAREAFESAVDVIRQSGLRDYPPLLSLEIELAYERGLEGDARAEADLRALFAKTAAPPGNVERVRALLALGHVLARNGKPQEAEPLLRESLGMRERLPKRDYRIAQAEFALAECFEAERRIPEARQMYQAALTDFRDHVGAEIWAARETAAHLQRISSEQ